jgi:hypothetical protein
MTDEDLERNLRPVIMSLVDLETKLEESSSEWAYVDTAQMALQRLLDPGGDLAKTLQARGAWRF